MMARKSIFISLFALSGCLVGPRYQTPDSTFSPEYLEAENDEGEEVDLRVWWKQFEDPILNEMIDEAISNNFNLKAAGERIAEARARYQYDSANLWPEIDLDGSAMRERNSQTLFGSSFLGPAVQNLYTIGFDASWELDFFGRLRSLKEASLDDYQASQENYRDVYITLLSEVVRNYTVLRALQEKFDLTEEQIRASKEEFSLAKSRYQAGLQSEISPLEAATSLEKIQATLFPIQASIHQTLYSLAVLLGKQPEEIPEKWKEPGQIPKARGKIPVGLPSDLLRRRPDIRQAERKLAAATAHIGAAIAQLFPSFSLTGGFGYQSNQTNTWIEKLSETWNIGPSISWPIIDFGRIRANINLQNALQREALDNYEETVLKALEDVESALTAYNNENNRLKKLSNAADRLKEVLDRTSSLYRAGLASFTQFLDAELQWLSAEQMVVDSEESLGVYLVAVYKSLGGEWECYSTP